ncbi:Uncharacterized protein APZ42_012002 [Daphnia magna]|uniref:Uncharacterized protein n=1 Tax=Daphnia magna TaxID=35525 RepID=A0A162SAW7_9CRUS|nr:Uncharacterized protein APZ42_012002 [Daphnia magna]
MVRVILKLPDSFYIHMEKPVETKTNDVGFEPKPDGRRMSSARQIVQGLPQGKPDINSAGGIILSKRRRSFFMHPLRVANAEPALPTITSGTRLPVGKFLSRFDFSSRSGC